MADAQWITETLDAMNTRRKLHGAPPLEWSEECYKAAKMQADACDEQNLLHHGYMEGPSGAHGQNAFMSSEAGRPEQAVEAWYNELNDPGYDFGKAGFDAGTGHFTQTVWVGSRSVGQAASPSGKYQVANFLPAGNVDGLFEKNVLPAGSEPAPVAPPPAIGTFTATAWNADLEGGLSDCPLADSLRPVIDEAFAAGSTVTVKRELNSIEITVTDSSGAMSMQSASW